MVSPTISNFTQQRLQFCCEVYITYFKMEFFNKVFEELSLLSKTKLNLNNLLMSNKPCECSSIKLYLLQMSKFFYHVYYFVALNRSKTPQQIISLFWMNNKDVLYFIIVVKVHSASKNISYVNGTKLLSTDPYSHEEN